MTLAELGKGESKTISSIIHDPEGHWRKLVVFGIMPGGEVTMLQRWPTLVVRIGRTEVGLDDITAKLVVLAEPESAPLPK